MKADFAGQVKTYSCWDNLQLGKPMVVIAFVPPKQKKPVGSEKRIWLKELKINIRCQSCDLIV